MRRRPASRLLVVDPLVRVLLFRFTFPSGALAGSDYWAAPGGGVDDGESFAEAARRELFEETGLLVVDAGEEVARRLFPMRLMSGEEVVADERFFLVRTAAFTPSRAGWSIDEVAAIADHRWWRLADLDACAVQAWPEDLADMVRDAVARPA